jgi:hypothetical protein
MSKNPTAQKTIKRHCARKLRVARWQIYFQTKTPNSGIFLESLGMDNVGIFYIWPFGLIDSLLVYLMDIWFSFLVCCTSKNLATLE